MRQVTFAFRFLLGEDMAFIRVLAFYFSGSGYFKALLGAGVGFNLWHVNIFTFTPGRRSRTDGKLMEPYG